MFEIFLKSNPSIKKHDLKNLDLIDESNIELISFFKECGGYSFGKGLYKTHLPESSLHWAIIISNYFPKYKSKIIPFGYDWMGRQFAIDTSRENYLLMFDPATGED